jgi:uncharacterized protein (TIGR04255 family)
MAVHSSSLPDFKSPPAVETLLGVYFRPLQHWKTQYFGRFWDQVRREYPEVQVHPPLISEQGLRVEVTPEEARIRVSGEIAVRWWYFHKSGKRLIQVQNDSFIQNWRKRGITDPYLHYDQLRPSFESLWGRFRAFLRSQSVQQPKIEVCEVTYVNHIDRGSGWDSLADLPNVVTCWSGETLGEFLPLPAQVSFNAIFPFNEKSGQLQVSMQPGIRESDKKETLQLTLTARCKPDSSETNELLRCLDLNRTWVVRGFADITTVTMHKIWGRKVRRPRRTK